LTVQAISSNIESLSHRDFAMGWPMSF